MELGERNGARATIERAADDAGTPVVTLTGELDISNVDQVRAVLDPIVDQCPDRLIFEIGELDFMDSSAIAVFLQVAGRVNRVELHNASRTVRRIIEATGLLDVLHLDS